MVRTSLVIPATLHQRLFISARQENKSIAELMREILDKALANRENARLKRMYDALAQIEGVGPKGIEDASTTINKTLYGG